MGVDARLVSFAFLPVCLFYVCFILFLLQEKLGEDNFSAS